MKPTRRSVLIATAGTGLAVTAGTALLLPAPGNAPQEAAPPEAPGASSSPSPAKLPLAARIPQSVTLQFDVAKLSAAGMLLRASVQSR